MQLLVRNLDESLVRNLKLQAAFHGVSTEEEHRRILQAAFSKVEVEPEVDPYGSMLREEPYDAYSSVLREDPRPSSVVSRALGGGRQFVGLDFKAHLLALGDLGEIELDRPRTYSRRRELEL